MKLSTAIKRGSKKYKQMRGDYVMYKGGQIYACALGAAFLEMHPEVVEQINKRKTARGFNKMINGWHNNNITRPHFTSPGVTMPPVTIMNDIDGMSLDEIVQAIKKGEMTRKNGEVVTGYVDPEVSK